MNADKEYTAKTTTGKTMLTDLQENIPMTSVTTVDNLDIGNVNVPYQDHQSHRHQTDGGEGLSASDGLLLTSSTNM